MCRTSTYKTGHSAAPVGPLGPRRPCRPGRLTTDRPGSPTGPGRAFGGWGHLRPSSQISAGPKITPQVTGSGGCICASGQGTRSGSGHDGCRGPRSHAIARSAAGERHAGSAFAAADGAHVVTLSTAGPQTIRYCLLRTHTSCYTATKGEEVSGIGGSLLCSPQF